MKAIKKIILILFIFQVSTLVVVMICGSNIELAQRIEITYLILLASFTAIVSFVLGVATGNLMGILGAVSVGVIWIYRMLLLVGG